jgi:membrane-associated phospholipid phosphatase
VLLAVPIVLVGPSRLYLGQHWLSDVLGGYALAVLFLVPYCWAYAKWRLENAKRYWGARKAKLHPAAANPSPSRASL